MTGNKLTWRPLMEIINDALTDCQGGMHRQFQFLRWGQKYAEELSFDFSRDIRTVKLNFKPWKSIELPVDCIDWVLVGIQDGEDVKTFVKDDYIPLIFQQDATKNNQFLPNQPPSYSSDLTQLPTQADYMFPYLNLTSLGEDPGKLFGLVVKDNGLGYFTENRNKDVSELQFSGRDIDLTKPVYLMYVSNIWDPKKETLIHPYQAEYIVAGTLKEYEKSRLSAGNGNGLAFKAASDEFDRQTLKIIDRRWDLRVEDIYEHLFKRGYQMTPKIP